MKPTVEDEKAAREHFKNPFEPHTSRHYRFESSIEPEVQAYLAGIAHERAKAAKLVDAIYRATSTGSFMPVKETHDLWAAVSDYKGTTDGE